jgi:hypothetical protein
MQLVIELGRECREKIGGSLRVPLPEVLPRWCWCLAHPCPFLQMIVAHKDQQFLDDVSTFEVRSLALVCVTVR